MCRHEVGGEATLNGRFGESHAEMGLTQACPRKITLLDSWMKRNVCTSFQSIQK